MTADTAIPSSHALKADTDTPHKTLSMHTSDDSDTASTSDASTLIARPAAAYTSSPFVFERNPSTMPGPLEEITPPPSPGTGRQSPSKMQQRKGHKPSASLSMTFAPLLSRAGSIIYPNTSSAATSPTRAGAQAPPTPEQSPDSASPNRRSRGFTDLFQFQGNSAPVSLGWPLTPSPKKEEAPEGSPFGPAHDHRPKSVASSVKSASPVRPGHVRRESTFSMAASFLGIGPSRNGSVSPVRQSARARTRAEDDILRLDFENEMFPNEFLMGKGEKAFDELLTNAEKLFNKMRTAYSRKCDIIQRMEDSWNADREELEEQRVRADMLKQQMDDLAERVMEKDVEIDDLKDEIEEHERDRCSRSIRVLPTADDRAPSQDTDQVRKIWSANGEDPFEIGDDSVSELGDENVEVFSSPSRPTSSSTAPTECPRPLSVQKQRQSMAWEDAAPFLPPEDRLQAENKDLRRRVQELEETLNSCLGLVE